MSDVQATPSTQQAADAVQDTSGFKVFAGNLPYSVTDESLKAFFAPIANDIITAQVITRGTRSAGYGFATVKSLEVAHKACELLDKKEIEGRQVVVEVAKPPEQKDKERSERRAKRRTGRARGRAPPGEVTEAEAEGETEKATETDAPTTAAEDAKGKPKKKKSPRKKSKKPAAGDPSAPLTDQEDSKDAAAPAAQPAKKPRQPREKRAPRPAGQDPVGEPSNTVLFVANLGFNVDDAGLRDLFTAAGIKVNSARVVRRRWGKPRKSKGYGFVDVGGEEEQKKAIAALQGKEIEGREIAVKIAVNATHDDDSDKEGANGVEGAAAQAPAAAAPVATPAAAK